MCQQRKTRKVQFESLENRELMAADFAVLPLGPAPLSSTSATSSVSGTASAGAGIASANFARGNLIISGTSANEHVTVHLEGQHFNVSINGRWMMRSWAPISELREIHAYLGSGTDVLQVTGSGQNRLNLQRAHVEMGSGGSVPHSMEQVQIHANSIRNLTIRGSTSQGTNVVLESRWVDMAMIDLSKGDHHDRVHTAIANAHEVTINTYGGNDIVSVTNNNLGTISRIDSARITTGAGNDVLELRGVQIQRGSIHMGSGQDIVAIDPWQGATIQTGGIEGGGDGNDILQGRNRLRGHVSIRGFRWVS